MIDELTSVITAAWASTLRRTSTMLSVISPIEALFPADDRARVSTPVATFPADRLMASMAVEVAANPSAWTFAASMTFPDASSLR